MVKVTEQSKRITILDEEGYWSTQCAKELDQAGLISVRQDPQEEFLEAKAVRGNLFVIRVPYFESDRFDLARRVGELGGMSLILAASEVADVAMKCMTLGRTACVGKTNDFPRLIEVVKAILSPGFKDQNPT